MTPAFKPNLELSLENLHKAFEDILTRAAEMGFKRMLLLSAHGPGFPEYASYAARKVSKRTGMKVLCVRAYDLLKRSEIEEMTGEPYIHGAPCETSLMLLFRPELVSLEEVREGAMNGLLSSRPSFTPKEGGSFTLGILGKQALKWERGCASYYKQVDRVVG